MTKWNVYSKSGEYLGQIETPFAKASGAKRVAAETYSLAYTELTVSKDEATDPMDDFNYVGSRHHY